MEKVIGKTKVTFYLSTETVEQIRELSFFLRQPRSSLIEQMIADAYRRWKDEQPQGQHCTGSEGVAP